MLPVRFRAILRRKSFSQVQSRTLIYRAPGSALFIIFARDRFQCSLFGLNMQPVQFRANLRRQPSLRAESRLLISRPSRERSLYNFLAQPLSIFVIWPKYATRVILRNF